MNFGFCIGKRNEDGRKDWKRYYDASVVAGETEFHQLAKAAQETRAYISLGFSERDAVNGTLYNSNVVFEPDGSYKVHRKLKPTGSERVVWGMLIRDSSLLQRRRGGRSAVWFVGRVICRFKATELFTSKYGISFMHLGNSSIAPASIPTLRLPTDNLHIQF